MPLPAALEDSVEKVIDQALDRRPDLIAKVTVLRSKEAEVRRARAAHWPTLSFVSNVNTLAGRVRITGGNQPTGWFSAAEPSYGAGLAFEWSLFEGGATDRRVELAEAERRVAERGCTRMRMTVLSARADLIAFYQRRGYATTGETQPFPYGDERFGTPKRDDLTFVELVKPLP